MKFYITQGFAFRGTEIRSLVDPNFAASEDEAIGRMVRLLQQRFPTEHGWKHQFGTPQYITAETLAEWHAKAQEA